MNSSSDPAYGTCPFLSAVYLVDSFKLRHTNISTELEGFRAGDGCSSSTVVSVCL